MRVVILVPMRYDGGWRDKLWSFCRDQWADNFPDWTIYEGIHTAEEGPFNRSQAINRAADAAGPWDIALIIDGDTISETEAVQRAVAHAHETGDLSIAHNARLMLNRRATERVLQGASFSTVQNRASVQKTYYDSISCAVAVRRDIWDAVKGFDEEFVGWGFEDTAFRIAVETVTNKPIHVEQANCLHLWHHSSPEASRFAPTYSKNHARKRRYEQAYYQPERVMAIIEGRPDPGLTHTAIPKILHRTVPQETSEQIEQWWLHFQELHPDWELKTWREPINPADFPLTGHLFDSCSSGAQKAGLIRLELLVSEGGVYVDSDVEAVRPLDSLTHSPAFAAWEDEKVIPDAVLGSAPGHPAFRECLARAVQLIEGGSKDAWETGPGVTTATLAGRDDVLVLPPGSFYPVHYLEKAALGSRNNQPWVFLEHKWHHSWGTKEQLDRNRRRQKGVTPLERKAPEPKPEPLDIPEGLVLCMPWRETGDEWRTRAYEWCLGWWHYHGFKVVEGTGDSRAAMCNNAAAKAIEAEASTLAIVDADTWVPALQLLEATALATHSGRLTHAFDVYVKTDSGTARKNMQNSSYARIQPRRISSVGRRFRKRVSGVSVLPVDLWNKVGGFDERFKSWGSEDQAFNLACKTLGGGVARAKGPAIHWYHRDDPTKSNQPDEDVLTLLSEYCSAAGEIPDQGRTSRLAAHGLITMDGSGPSVERMQSLLSQPGGPLSVPGVIV